MFVEVLCKDIRDQILGKSVFGFEPFARVFQNVLDAKMMKAILKCGRAQNGKPAINHIAVIISTGTTGDFYVCLYCCLKIYSVVIGFVKGHTHYMKIIQGGVRGIGNTIGR